MKKEYYTEIWTLAVNNACDTVYTGRDNEIIVADITERKVFQNFLYTTQTFLFRIQGLDLAKVFQTPSP